MNLRLCLLSGCLMTLAVGCSEPRPEGMPDLHPAAITVTQGGSPLADASVTLLPQDSALARWPVGGVTDSAGVVKLHTFSKYAGAPAGTFKVIVNKTVTEGDALPVHPGANATRDQINAYDRAVKSGKFEVFQVVAAEHRMPNTTKLSVDIAAGANTLTLDVGAAVKEKEANANASSRTKEEYRTMGE